MMTKKNTCAEALTTYAKKRNQNTIQRVNQVLDQMQKERAPINFETVARLAGVSRGTLYNNEELRVRIQRLRAGDSAVRCDALREKTRSQEEKLRALRRQIQHLEEEKKLLIVQLLDYEELKAENERLRVQLADDFKSYNFES